MVVRMTRDLPGWLRRPVSLEESKAKLRADLGTRPERFLVLAERAFYGQPRSPYARLLRYAGVELGDLREMVEGDGLEPALQRLAQAGVYVRFDEMKGRIPAVRGSTTFQFHEDEFDNPLVAPHFVIYTGGSRGRPTRVRRSLALLRETGIAQLLGHAAHGRPVRRRISYFGAPLQGFLTAEAVGQHVVAWYRPTPVYPLWARAAVWYLSALARVGGRSMARGPYCNPQEPWPLGERALRELDHGQPVELNCSSSVAVRVAEAALARGVSLRGINFTTSGEPLTGARRDRIVRSGATILAHYGTRETALIGLGCPNGTSPDDMHLFSDRHALVTHPRRVVQDGPMVDAMLLTSLSPYAAKLLLNAENGDYADIENRDCGCLLGELGLRTHLSNVRSFEKLTGEGVTFARTTLMAFLEVDLPERFGGSSVDYQLAEEEQPDSSTRLVLRVHPGVGAVDERALVAALLSRLGSEGLSPRIHAEMLRNAGAVRVLREPPLATAAGKVLPFHLVRRA